MSGKIDIEKLANKERLDDETIAARASKEIEDGKYVNLGFGIPTLIGVMPPVDKTVFFQSETGLLNYGKIVTQEEADSIGWIYVNASGQPVEPLAGMSIFEIEEAFDMIRSGAIDIAILGAFQVSAKGDLANWSSPGVLTSVGGAMDLAAGVENVWVCMKHLTPKNEFKIVKKCSLPLTRKRCVSLIFTDIAVIEVAEEELILREVAPEWAPDEVQALTEPGLKISPELRVMEL